MRIAFTIMLLAATVLPASSQSQTVNICDRTPQVRDEIMLAIGADDCAAVTARQLAGVGDLCFSSKHLPRICRSSYSRNPLIALKAGDFDGLYVLTSLDLSHNRLTTLPNGVFDSLNVAHLDLSRNRLTTLPNGAFDSLTVGSLDLSRNRLTTLPNSVFDGMTGLQNLNLNHNQLTALPNGVFDGMTSLDRLWLNNNRLTTLPNGVFDDLEDVELLDLSGNRLTALPAALFDGLLDLDKLDLRFNHLVGLARNDLLFATLPKGHWVEVLLDGQTEAPEEPGAPEQSTTRIPAAVPLLVSASDSMRQGFVRIVNLSNESGSVRILAFDDAGAAATPVEIQLGAKRAFHFNAGDLENGNANKGISAGIGRPVQGHWRLDVETALDVRVLAFVRTGDGFLTAMHDVLQRDSQGRLTAWTFNPASNTDRVSWLRLVNAGATAESVSIDGVDDRGNAAGPVTLTLASGASRTLSAGDLEDGAQGLTGALDDGAGKWRLFITAGQSVVGVSLLESASGHWTNLSTMGSP